MGNVFRGGHWTLNVSGDGVMDYNNLGMVQLHERRWRRGLLLLLLTAGIPSLFAESIYLLAGVASGAMSPATYESELYRVEPGKPVQLVRRICTAQEGLAFLVPDYETGVIALARPYGNPDKLEMISMAEPSTPFVRPITLADIPRGQWQRRAAPPGRGHLSKLSPEKRLGFLSRVSLLLPGLRQESGGGRTLSFTVASAFGEMDSTYTVSAGVAMAAISGTARVRRVPDFQSEAASLRSAGVFGLPGLGSKLALLVQSRGGRWYLGGAGGTTELPLSVPADLPSGPHTWWAARSSEIAVMSLDAVTADLAKTPPGWLRVYRELDRSWETVQVGGPVLVRLIGEWVLAVESDQARGRGNPGNGRRKSGSRHRAGARPATDSILASSYLPGTMTLFNAASRRTWIIRTNEADSEPLLVRNDTLYYRVNDRILAADLVGSGTGPAREIARGDVYRDVHVAFAGP